MANFKKALIFLVAAASSFAAPNTPINNLILQNGGAVQTGVVQANGTSPAIGSNTINGLTIGTTPALTGAVATAGTPITPVAGVATLLVTKPLMSIAASGALTLAFSATPNDGTSFSVITTASVDSPVTFPSGVYSYDIRTNITSPVTVLANTSQKWTFTREAAGRWAVQGTGVATSGSGGVYLLQNSPIILTSLGINTGTTLGATSLQVVDTGTSAPRGITNDQYNTGTNSAQFNARKARGTFASPSTIVTGDLLARFIGWGYDSANFIESGNVRMVSSGTIATNRIPSQFEVWTSTDAAPSVLTKALTIDNAQKATFVGEVITPASTTTSAGLTLPSGTAPSAPSNGDLWYDGASFKGRQNGSTVSLGGGTPGGSTTQIQLNNAGAFGGVSGLVADLTTGAVTQTQTSLGSTPTAGLTLVNTTAAANGAQQWSPSTVWQGNGWKSDVTAGSQTVAFRASTQPVQGTATPTGLWTLQSSLNGAGFANSLTYSSAGTLAVPTNLTVGGTISNAGGLKRVTSQFDAAATTTLANVTGLSVTVASSTSYRFRAVLFANNDATGGQKYAIGGTATATNVIYNINALDNTTNLFVITSRQTALAGSAGQAGSTASYTVIEGSIAVNAGGTLTVQFAQNAATGTSSILVGSYFQLMGF